MANSNSDPDYYLPSSDSLPKLHNHNQNPRMKRSKIEFEPLMDSSSVSKPRKYYSKKPDPSAPKITVPCSECGKKFWSWKALFGHMRCHPERQWRGINPPPHYRKPVSPVEDFTAEDHQVASSLILLANNGGNDAKTSSDEIIGHKCSICMRVFSSGQALGGHKRCHWEKGEDASSSSSPLMNNRGINAYPTCTDFDLNLPPVVEDDRHQSSTSCSSAFTSPSSLALDLTLGL